MKAGPEHMIPISTQPPEDGTYFAYLGCTCLDEAKRYYEVDYIVNSETDFYVGWQANRVTHWAYIKK
jgi:hypothetical protein